MALLSEISKAMITANIQLLDVLETLPSDTRRTIIARLVRDFANGSENRDSFNASFYQHLHDENSLYQANNWLLDRASTILASGCKSVLELGSGNGKFARSIASQVDTVFAVDWAHSPLTGDLPENCKFIQADITDSELPKSDIACSADVLEHVPFDKIESTLRTWHEVARLQYHVIACYDDKESHLTIMPPGMWLYYFKQIDSNHRFDHIELRRDNHKQIVCTITNIPQTV